MNIIDGFGLVAEKVISGYIDITRVLFTGNPETRMLVVEAAAEDDKFQARRGGTHPEITFCDVSLAGGE